jgi:hypothetical protein
VNVPRFLSVSAVTGVAVYVIARVLYRELWPDVALAGMTAAVVAAVMIGCVGWLIAGRGLKRDPKQFPAYFVVGLLTKLLLMGVAILVVWLLRISSLQDFLVPFAAAFAVIGIVQMIVVARMAIARLGNEKGGREAA